MVVFSDNLEHLFQSYTESQDSACHKRSVWRRRPLYRLTQVDRRRVRNNRIINEKQLLHRAEDIE